MINTSKIVKLLIAGITVLSITIILTVLYHNQSVKSIPGSTDRQITEKANESDKKPIADKLFVINPVSGNTNDKPINMAKESQNDDRQNNQVNRNNISSIEPNSYAPIKGQTPIEILQKYNKITSSPEFTAEAHNILFNSKMEQIKLEEKIKELEAKEKELERNLEEASDDRRSDIADDLRKTKDDSLETKVELAKKIILADDALQKLKLRYITLDEIRIAQQEIRKNPPPFPLTGSDDKSETEKMAWAEALRQLKADGWTPNPLRSYQLDHNQ